MAREPQERRSSTRHSDFNSDCLTIETTLELGMAQALNATLLDVSQGGLGIALRVPAAIGDEVDVDGSLNRPGDFFLIRGRARVAYCIHLQTHQHFRVGLAFHEFHCQNPDGTPASLPNTSNQHQA